jgi:type I restriction enzyme, S subunit
MERWPLVRLGDLLTQSVERCPVEADQSYPNVGIYGFGRGMFPKPPIDGATTSASALYRLHAGQLVYSRLFAFEGAYAKVPESADGAYVSNEYPAFDIDTERVVPGYLEWFLRWPNAWQQLSKLTSGMGDRRRRLQPGRFLSFQVGLPPVDEQRRIVAKIDAVAARLDEANRLRQEVQNDADALLHSVFHRLIQGADYRPLAEVAPIVRRPVEIELDGEYPELGVRSFGKGVFHKPVLKGAELDWQKLYRIQAGDLVISNIKAWEGAIAVARDCDDGRVGSHRYITCVPKEGMATADFVCFYLLTQEGLEQIGHASPGSADRNRTLAMSRLEQITVPLTGIDAQQHFSALLSKVAAVRQTHEDNQAELIALLPAVLDKAFRGEL